MGPPEGSYTPDRWAIPETSGRVLPGRGRAQELGQVATCLPCYADALPLGSDASMVPTVKVTA